MDLLFSIYGENPLQDKYTSFPKLILMIFTYSLSYFYIGYTLAYFTTFGATFLNFTYGIALLGFFRVLYMSLVAFGAGFGTLISKFVIQKYPKREFILMLNGVAMFLGCLMLWIDNIYLVFIIRLCQGICVGLYSMIIPVILKEISPQKTINRVTAINYSIFALSLVLIYTFAYKLSSVYILNKSAGMGWTTLCTIPLIIIAIQSLILQFMFPFQTVHYYVKNNRFQEAEKALDTFYKKYQVIQILKKTEDQIQQKQKSKAFVQIQNNKEDEQIDFRNKNYNAGNPLLLNREVYFQRQKSKYNIMATFFMVFLQQFSGITPIIPYAFWYCYNAVPDKFYFPLIIFLIMLVFSQGMPTLIQKVNTKTIIMVSTIACAIASSLISYGLYYNEDPVHLFWNKNSAFIIIGLIILMINYGISVGPIFDIYIEQIVPNNFYYIVKAIGWGINGFIIMGCSTDWRSSVMFLIFSIWAVLSIFINYKFQIETKGKNKAQIEEEYQRMAAAL